MYSGKQHEDDSECLKVDKFEPNRAELGKKKSLDHFMDQIRGDMQIVTHTWVCAHYFTHTYTTPPFVLGVILCRSVSRDIPLWFSEWSDSLPSAFLIFFFQRRTLRPVCSSRGSPCSLGRIRLP